MSRPGIAIAGGAPVELVVLVVVAAWAAAVDFAGAPNPIPFIERDPSLSYPRMQQTVPTSVLVAISIGVPGVMYALGALLAVVRRKLSLWAALVPFAWLCIALAQALLLSDAIANTAKVWMSFQRPNYFALCDYKGFLSNSTAYLQATVPGALGDPGRCVGNDAWDAQRSFPSGHATTATAGMAMASLFLRAALGVRRGDYYGPASLAATAPLVIALWISISRVRDRWHNVVDVISGAILGALCAVLAWAHFQSQNRGRGLLAGSPPPCVGQSTVTAALLDKGSGDRQHDGAPAPVGPASVACQVTDAAASLDPELEGHGDAIARSL